MTLKDECEYITLENFIVYIGRLRSWYCRYDL